jgi:hypothetical protein
VSANRYALRVLALGLGSLPGVALACPLCLAAKDEAVQMAFLLTTVLLSALPVIMIGGLIIWIAKRSRDLDREERAPEPLPVAEPAPPAPETPVDGELMPLHR